MRLICEHNRWPHWTFSERNNLGGSWLVIKWFINRLSHLSRSLQSSVSFWRCFNAGLIWRMPRRTDWACTAFWDLLVWCMCERWRSFSPLFDGSVCARSMKDESEIRTIDGSLRGRLVTTSEEIFGSKTPPRRERCRGAMNLERIALDWGWTSLKRSSVYWTWYQACSGQLARLMW